MSLRNKVVVVLLLVVIVGSSVWFSINLFKEFTEKMPDSGGRYTEALVGQPNYLNPLLDKLFPNDSAIDKLIYSGLFEYDAKGNLASDLADKYERNEGGKEYTVFLKQNVKWHDGEQFDADDVIFTINLIKNKDYGAVGVDAGLRISFDGVNLEKIDDFTVKFILEEEQFDFLHSLTVGILPKHMWSEVNINNFLLSKLNKNPIGTGPFELVKRDEDGDYVSSYTLRSYKNYHKGKPLINKVVFKFYPNRVSAIEAYNNGEVMSVIATSSEYIASVNEKNTEKKIMISPSYFSIFFNQKKSVPLAFDEVRKSLSLATNNEEIVKKIFGDIAVPMYSPLMQNSFGYSDKYQQNEFNIEEANKLLEEKGWKMEDDGIRKKDDARLEFTLHINSSQSSYVKIANILKDQWKQIGADVKILEHDKNSLVVDVINPRNFEALLSSHSTRFSDPNFLSLWHSKAEDSGANYAGMKDDALDKILEDLQKEINQDKRRELYEKLQEQIKSENPAVFLFSSGFAFMHNDRLKGVTAERINSSKGRYSDVHLWYLKEKYVLKKK
ncbi:MAG: hypothetical protein KAT32_01315 [Candidatus Moranbacteria bacterium]|nr:hypothetical protein [Candidatus Moranbacteria bacterium]